MDFVLCVLGAALVLEGLPFFLFPGRMKEALLEMAKNEDRALRTLGFCILVTGAVFLWFGGR
ncbi:MAG: DUF2065 domain-containing protein [Deltaproteobacteria bacterium]|nr:DUF2065 domain-containing protein [Deltaproteobacteria bacterium]